MQAKKIILAMLVLLGAVTAKSQNTVQGSLRQDLTDPNTVDVLFKANYDATAGEKILYFSLAIAVPTSATTPGLTPTIAPSANFAGLSFTPAATFTAGTETIYTWIYGGPPTNPYLWTNGNEFVFATIKMGWGGNGTVPVRIVDFTNYVPSGGDNSNAYFLLYTTANFDVTNYSSFFYTNSGGNGSTASTYGNGDQYVQSNASIVLPANITSFSGYKNGSKNTLQWTTASESNSRGFDVQRATDGVTYSSIGFVSSLTVGGNSSSNLNYSFDDNSPAGSRNYYRLNQVDFDGKSKLSKVAVISSGDQVSSLAISGTYPNPAISVVNVMVDAPARDQITLQFNDLSGKLVKQHIADVSIGSNTIPVDVSGLAKGNYIIKLTNKSGTKSTLSRFVKQ